MRAFKIDAKYLPNPIRPPDAIYLAPYTYNQQLLAFRHLILSPCMSW
ncbi:MAG: hypothetical protein ABS948_16385 [Solibacillus sp.]